MNKNDYIIRNERPEDYRATEELTREAFWNLSEPGCNEHYLVHTMRSHEDFVPELSFVMEKDGRIIGTIMYCRATLVDEQGNEKSILSFGPICVHPDYKRRGYGKALMSHSFRLAVEMGYDTVVIFGNPNNYVTSGFKCCKRHNVCLEGDVFHTALLVNELVPGALDGHRWYYHGSSAESACEDQAAVDAFDATFPPKEKKWQPSQEEFYIHSHSAVIW